VHAFAALALALALAVRLYWVFRVQSPYAAIYSDMGGYVERANNLLNGIATSYPRLSALYPYGAHYFYAGEFAILGFHRQHLVSIAQAVLCASPTYFFVLFASRFFARAWAPGLLGVVFALWQPVVWCTGYFLSEVPYLAFLYLNAWLCLRFVETKRGGFALGLTSAILFTVRPQFILTFALLSLAYLWSERSRLLSRPMLGGCARVLAPWLVVLVFSVGRYHHLTGTWGLISENGQLNRVFSDTTVGRVEAHWKAPDGSAWGFTVVPPTKTRMNERDVVTLQGYIGDATLLAAVRAQHLQGKSMFWRIHRAFDNVRLLWDKNNPWPEEDGARAGLRKHLQDGFNGATRWVVIPLAMLGLVVLPRRAPYVVVLAHLITLVVLSMFFLPEARYRVPYDPFLVLLAFAGTWRLESLVRTRLTARARGVEPRSPERRAPPAESPPHGSR
jgi:hypothetical protein